MKRVSKGGTPYSLGTELYDTVEHLDLNDVMSVFDEYIKANKRIEQRMIWMLEYLEFSYFKTPCTNFKIIFILLYRYYT